MLMEQIPIPSGTNKINGRQPHRTGLVMTWSVVLCQGEVAVCSDILVNVLKC